MRGTAAGIAVGVVADALFGDPQRLHPVAGFGAAVTRLERLLYADRRANGVAFTALAVGVPVGVSWWLQRHTAGMTRDALLALVTWAALGGTSLAREGLHMQHTLVVGDLVGARRRLGNLCARDATALEEGEVVRATVESLAENASDAAVAPLLWAAVAGIPGVVGYRCVNTLDAMVGYRSERYENFGWAAARLDDLANVVPSRLAGLLAVLLAPAAGGRTPEAFRVWRRDRNRHPSPNAGQVEAAFAGALEVTLGGVNSYHGAVEVRSELGDGPVPEVADLGDAVRLARLVMVVSAVTAVLLTWGSR